MKKVTIVLLIAQCIILIATAQIESKETIPSYITFKQREKQEREDDEAMFNAKQYPIMKLIKDTLDADSLVLWYYHSGGLYQQIPYKNGKINGIREIYYPNGQLDEKEMFVDDRVQDGFFSRHYTRKHYVGGFRVYGHSSIAYDRYGEPCYIRYFGKYKGKKIHLEKQICFGIPCGLMVYNKKGRLIKEYDWVKETQTWVETWYHIGVKRSLSSKKIKAILNSLRN